MNDTRHHLVRHDRPAPPDAPRRASRSLGLAGGLAVGDRRTVVRRGGHDRRHLRGHVAHHGLEVRRHRARTRR